VVTALPFGLMSVARSASRADSKWLTRMGSPAFSGTRRRCPTGVCCSDEPCSSAWMNEPVTNFAGISLTATISAESSVPSATSTLAQSTFTVCQRSRTLRSRARSAAQAVAPASKPSASAMRRGFLPESTRPPPPWPGCYADAEGRRDGRSTDNSGREGGLARSSARREPPAARRLCAARAVPLPAPSSPTDRASPARRGPLSPRRIGPRRRGTRRRGPGPKPRRRGLRRGYASRRHRGRATPRASSCPNGALPVPWLRLRRPQAPGSRPARAATLPWTSGLRKNRVVAAPRRPREARRKDWTARHAKQQRPAGAMKAWTAPGPKRRRPARRMKAWAAVADERRPPRLPLPAAPPSSGRRPPRRRRCPGGFRRTRYRAARAGASAAVRLSPTTSPEPQAWRRDPSPRPGPSPVFPRHRAAPSRAPAAPPAVRESRTRRCALLPPLSPGGTRRSRRGGSPPPRRESHRARHRRGRGAGPGTRCASCPPQSHVHDRLVRGGLFRDTRRGERLAQPLQCVAHAALHRVLVHSDHLGDLPERHSRLFAEDEHLALLRRQAEKRLLQEGPDPGARSRALWVDLATRHGVDHRGLAVGPFRIEAIRAPETIPPRLVDAEIARDRVQPGLEARAPFPGRRALDDSQERLLRQILGPLAVAQHTQEEREQRGTVPAQEGLEGPRVALLVSGQQLLVGAFLCHLNAPVARPI